MTLRINILFDRSKENIFNLTYLGLFPFGKNPSRNGMGIKLNKSAYSTIDLNACNSTQIGVRMNENEMMKYVDHTQLNPVATWEDIQQLCEEAIEYKTASVCVPPAYIKRIHDTYGDGINICTVVGFPLGYHSTEAKLAEVEAALRNGCNEIDMVVNISDVKNGLFDKVEAEIKEIKKACGNHILKVIIETCYLTEEEKIAMCHAVTNAGADYIKTSTGFGSGGATRKDIELFKKHIGSHVKIKAAGGVSTLDDLSMFIEMGCERIGTSRAVNLIKGKAAQGY